MTTPFAIERPSAAPRNPCVGTAPGYRRDATEAANDVDHPLPVGAGDPATDFPGPVRLSDAGPGRVAIAPFDLRGPVATTLAALAATVGSLALLEAIARIAVLYG